MSCTWDNARLQLILKFLPLKLHKVCQNRKTLVEPVVVINYPCFLGIFRYWNSQMQFNYGTGNGNCIVEFQGRLLNTNSPEMPAGRRFRHRPETNTNL